MQKILSGEVILWSGVSNWFGQMSEGYIAWWPSPLIQSISFSLCLPMGYLFSPLVLPFPFLPDAPSITRHQQGIRFRSCRWENEIISSSISSSSSPTAANSCSSWCFFLKPQVQELYISSSFENKTSPAPVIVEKSWKRVYWKLRTTEDKYK